MTKGLVGSNYPPFRGKVYLIDKGRRRWVKNVEIIRALGYKWPDDVRWVDAQDLKQVPLGPNVPESLVKNNSIQSMARMREFIVSKVSGKGVEFGAAANPMPIPVGVKIQYADLFSAPMLEEELYSTEEKHEYVDADIITSFDKMDGIPSNSLDFIIASHVIEHVRNPILSLALAWQKLRKDGLLVLIVPKMERTLDSKRPLTSLSHLIEDYSAPNRYRDALHVAEFHTYAKELPLAEVYQKMLNSINDDHHSMHYHVWNESNFKELLKYVSRNYFPWKIKDFKSAISGDENYEFYVVLAKTR